MSEVQVDDHGLTPEEREVKDLITEANRKYMKIIANDHNVREPRADPDLALWLRAYDQMADQLAYRVVRREYPVGWGGVPESALEELAKDSDG